MVPFLLMASVALCPSLSLKGLRDLTRHQDETKVIFFASWCADCKTNLSQKQPPGTIFVATFDEKAAAEQVIKQGKIATPCYMDDGLAENLGVHGVPAVLTVDREGRVTSAKP